MTDLEVHVDPSTLTRGNHSITGVCFVRFRNVEFPESTWSDFPTVILAWWLRAVASLAEGEEEDLRFMDGPFLIRIHRGSDDALRVQLVEERVTGMVVESEGSGSLRQVIEACEGAASRVLDTCDEQAWSDSDIEELRQLVGSRRSV